MTKTEQIMELADDYADKVATMDEDWGTERKALKSAIEALVTDLNNAVNLLTTMFDLYEDGVQCYEEPEDCTGFLGHAVRLDDLDFDAIVELLNKLGPQKEAP